MQNCIIMIVIQTLLEMTADNLWKWSANYNIIHNFIFLCIKYNFWAGKKRKNKFCIFCRNMKIVCKLLEIVFNFMHKLLEIMYDYTNTKNWPQLVLKYTVQNNDGSFDHQLSFSIRIFSNNSA